MMKFKDKTPIKNKGQGQGTRPGWAQAKGQVGQGMARLCQTAMNKKSLFPHQELWYS